MVDHDLPLLTLAALASLGVLVLALGKVLGDPREGRGAHRVPRRAVPGRRVRRGVPGRVVLLVGPWWREFLGGEVRAPGHHGQGHPLRRRPCPLRRRPLRRREHVRRVVVGRVLLLGRVVLGVGLLVVELLLPRRHRRFPRAARRKLRLGRPRPLGPLGPLGHQPWLARAALWSAAWGRARLRRNRLRRKRRREQLCGRERREPPLDRPTGLPPRRRSALPGPGLRVSRGAAGCAAEPEPADGAARVFGRVDRGGRPRAPQVPAPPESGQVQPDGSGEGQRRRAGPAAGLGGKAPAAPAA
mmetsp:Transcript_55391/g.125878  ORF Transcript_55391/g.125878 Transcript_55391/m.125878 type:complete len:300 (+) Transcript_55391:498-1397(+)